MVNTMPAVALLLLSTPVAAAVCGPAPRTENHYIIADAEDYGAVSALGFNVLALETPEAIDELPPGAMGIAQVGECNGVTESFKDRINSYARRDPGGKILAYYIMDEPAPENCDPADLKAQANWVHENIPGSKTFGVLFGPSRDYMAYAQSFDYVGLSPYPCRGGGDCDYSYITSEAEKIIAAGVPRDRIVPIYQSFGMPDAENPAAQLNNIDQAQNLATWAEIAPNPPFEYVWTWKRINAQLSLRDSPEQQAFFREMNACRESDGDAPAEPPALRAVECSGASFAEQQAWIKAAGPGDWDFSCEGTMEEDKKQTTRKIRFEMIEATQSRVQAAKLGLKNDRAPHKLRVPRSARKQ